MYGLSTTATANIRHGMRVALKSMAIHVRPAFGRVIQGYQMAAPLHALDDVVLRRVQGEYIEMPGLRLTSAQAQRLLGLDRASCDALLGVLVERKFLFRTRDGAFVRFDNMRMAS